MTTDNNEDEAEEILIVNRDMISTGEKPDKPKSTTQPKETKNKYANKKWIRGVNKANEGQTDKFYSASKEVAANFATTSTEDKPKYETIQEQPKNPLIVNDKTELAEKIGYKGDPLAEGLDKKQKFDSLAKKYAQDKGHDAIIYEEGTFGEPELHHFDVNKPATPTDTPEFKNWFKDSKVVDKEGKPLIVYHGTDKKFNEFSTEKIGDIGFHFGTKEQAEKFTNEKGRVLPVYLNAKNILTVPDIFSRGGEYVKAVDVLDSENALNKGETDSLLEEAQKLENLYNSLDDERDIGTHKKNKDF